MFVASGWSLNPETWIGDGLPIIGGLSVKNLTIPGTHDSGSYYLTPADMPGDASEFWDAVYTLANELDKSVGEVALLWSRTQDLNFYQQMQGGIRYFDLRAGYNKTTSTWVTFHFLQGAPVIELLQNISEYMKTYRSEIVIIEISHFRGNPTEQNIIELKNLVYQILGPLLCPVDLNFGFNIGQMVSSGQRALVTMESGFDGKFIWPPDAIYNTYADTPDLGKMIVFNNETVQRFEKEGCSGCLFKISWTLTAGNKEILESVVPWKPHSLIELADHANKALPSFWNSIKKNKWRMGNVLIIDHFESSQIMNVVWSNNGLV